MAEAIDEDDLLVVMSDHGIRASMEHDENAMFVVTGKGVPHGRAEGRPALQGVPRVVANLLGVDPVLRDTKIAPWALALGRAHH